MNSSEISGMATLFAIAAYPTWLWIAEALRKRGERKRLESLGLVKRY